jgi:UDP-2-acetamido-2-deoxy-ribo-hexuluronate aminotransferase
MTSIQMVDLKSQYSRIKSEIDEAVLDCISAAEFINGPQVKRFEKNLASYLGARHVIGCANGTDALQVAFMALGLGPGDEVIVPAFTYVATAEAAALLGLKPVMVDVDPDTFNVTATSIDAAITKRTRAVVPVHLFGQSCDLNPILEFCRSKGIFVIEDNAQALGATYSESKNVGKKTGTLGDVGCTSFFPSKNLGCYGDGGALTTNDDDLADRLRLMANHGQAKKYYHSMIGVNSRLDSIQAAILDVKLRYLDEYCYARAEVAKRYDEAFSDLNELAIPFREPGSTHVFHQYTLKVAKGKRDELKKHLSDNGIPSAIYYPLPLYNQGAYRQFVEPDFSLPVTEMLCESVLSLPIHTEMDERTQTTIIDAVSSFFGY